MFDPRTQPDINHFHSLNPTKPINDSYDSWGSMDFGAKARKNPRDYEDFRKWDGGGVQFRAEKSEDESGVCSPPLWKASPPTSPVDTLIDHRILSPNSRTQAIARGQWELMEMVKKLPESSYELSLKDLVENHGLGNEDECLVEEKHLGREIGKQRVKVTKWQESVGNRPIYARGLLLNMVFPISLGLRKKKNSLTNVFSRVSPKPEANSEKSSKGVDDKEWGKKRFLVSSGSKSTVASRNSSGSSSSSCGSSTRRRSGCSPGCGSLFFFRKH